MKEIVEKIILEIDKNISKNYEGDTPKLAEEYKTFEISKKNFHKFEITKEDKKICFVDGGNAEIIGSANFSLQLIRVYACVFSKNIVVQSKKNDFFLLAKTVGGKEIKYECEIFPIKGETLIDVNDLGLDYSDETIKEGIFNAKIGKIAELARRFSEIKLAEKMIEKLDKEDIIVLDGTLESNYTNEEKYLERLYDTGLKNNVLITALAKTTTILTKNGNNLIGLLNSIGEKDLWYYHPIAETNNKKHKAEIFVVRLNKKAEHVFRFEAFKEQKNKIGLILGKIALNSTDISFPGYPYGLIKADKIARISNKEKEGYTALFLAKMGKIGVKLNKYLSSQNAHLILDNQY